MSGVHNIESYTVTLEGMIDLSPYADRPELDEVIGICERLYKVSYSHWQYYVDPKRTGWVYCGSDYMGRIVDVRASREVGAHQVFEAVAAMVKL